MNSGIYIIQNKANGKIYVGSAVDIERRWRDHKKDLRKGKHHSPRLQHSWNKHGEENFQFLVLTLCDSEFLIKNEQMWLDKTRSYLPEKGYNICQTAGSWLGLKHSEESKRKMREGRNPKGYTYHKAAGKYAAAISINGKSKHLGLYDTPEAARAAYLAELEIVQQKPFYEAREGK